MPYSTFLTKFNYLPPSATAATAVTPAPSLQQRGRAPSLPPATLAQQLARSGATAGSGKALASQGFKMLRPVSQAGMQQLPPKRPSHGAGGTPIRRDGENLAPSGAGAVTDKGKGKEKWEMEVLIDGSSPDVARKHSVEKKRTRVIESDEDEEEGEEAPPKKVSPSIGRQDRIKPMVQMMELVDGDKEDDPDVQIMGPPSKVRPAGKLPSAAGSTFKGLASSIGVNKSQQNLDDTHYYLVRSLSNKIRRPSAD